MSWSVSSGKVSPTGEGEAILLASPDVYVANYNVKVTVPAGMADSKARLVLAHDGDDTYYAVVFTKNNGLELYHIVDGDFPPNMSPDPSLRWKVRGTIETCSAPLPWTRRVGTRGRGGRR